jgi:O-antigen ligase
VTNALRRSIGFDAAHAHNGAIGLLLDAGIVGTALFAVVLGQAVVLVVHCLRRRETSDYGRWALLTVAALVLMSVSEPLFEGPDLGLLVIMIVVLLRVRNDERLAQGGSAGRHARGTSASHSLA